MAVSAAAVSGSAFVTFAEGTKALVIGGVVSAAAGTGGTTATVVSSSNAKSQILFGFDDLLIL